MPSSKSREAPGGDSGQGASECQSCAPGEKSVVCGGDDVLVRGVGAAAVWRGSTGTAGGVSAGSCGASAGSGGWPPGGAAAALGGAASVIGGIFNKATGKSGGGFGGGGGADDLSEPAAVTALKDFQEQMRDLDRLLVDNDACEFVVVSIPTALSINESERLLAALKERKIAARRGVLNRLVSADAEEAYLARMAKGQGVCLGELTDLAARSDVSVTRVPFFDTEVRSVYGLRAMSAALFD